MASHYTTEATLYGVLFGLSSVAAKLMRQIMTQPMIVVNGSYWYRCKRYNTVISFQSSAATSIPIGLYTWRELPAITFSRLIFRHVTRYVPALALATKGRASLAAAGYPALGSTRTWSRVELLELLSVPTEECDA